MSECDFTRLKDSLRTTERQVEEIRENLPSILARARTRMLERENEQLTKMRMKTNNNAPTRRHIEDMTLGEIKEAKSRLGSKIIKAIHNEVSAFRMTYDCGDIDIRVTSTIREVKTEQGEAILPARVEYNVDIHFSEEDI